MASANYDRGTAPLRLEWTQETETGVTPDSPSWSAFSYAIQSYFSWEPDANTTRLESAGSLKPQGFFNGSETHSQSFEYSLVRWLKDGSGNTQDPAADFLDVAADNSLKATHSIVGRQEYASGGNDDAGRRHYVVTKGAHPSTVTLPFETEEGTPIQVSLEYEAEKTRSYNIHQPSAGTTLEVVSSNANDTTQTLTIEDEGAATTEDVSLNGTTAVTTTATFDDIDAAHLDAETQGDITISDGSGTTFMTIEGSESYNHGEGDLGVPALDGGSHAGSISEGNEVVFLDDTLDYDGTEIADEIESGELSVDLGIADNSQSGTPRRNYHPESWTAEVTASVAGEGVTEKQMVDYLTGEVHDIKWTAQQGSVTLSDTRLMSPGEFVGEDGQAKLMLDGTWEAEDITVSNEGA